MLEDEMFKIKETEATQEADAKRRLERCQRLLLSNTYTLSQEMLQRAEIKFYIDEKEKNEGKVRNLEKFVIVKDELCQKLLASKERNQRESKTSDIQGPSGRNNNQESYKTEENKVKEKGNLEKDKCLKTLQGTISAEYDKISRIEDVTLKIQSQGQYKLEYLKKAIEFQKEVKAHNDEMKHNGSLEKHNEIKEKIKNIYHEVRVLKKEVCGDSRVHSEI